MSYERLDLQNGQKVNADHLRHMEDGIVNASNMLVAITQEDYNALVSSGLVQKDVFYMIVSGAT